MISWFQPNRILIWCLVWFYMIYDIKLVWLDYGFSSTTFQIKEPELNNPINLKAEPMNAPSWKCVTQNIIRCTFSCKKINLGNQFT